jgi:hypothetical protein
MVAMTLPMSPRPGAVKYPKENHVEDKTLRCVDCAMDFVFTAGEQEFYATKGFTNEPKRCGSCRQAKKQQRVMSEHYDDSDRHARAY